MKPVLVLYATREGHTKKIAEYIATTAQAHGLAAAVINSAHVPPNFSLREYSAAFLTASVHLGQHEKEMTSFVKSHVGELNEMPTAFLSVSLAEAGAENLKATKESRANAVLDVRRMIEQFLVDTGWHPMYVRAVAGALLYRNYNFLMRFIMKRIAAKAGGDTDTSRNYEYTDWSALDDLVEKFAEKPELASTAP